MTIEKPDISPKKVVRYIYNSMAEVDAWLMSEAVIDNKTFSLLWVPVQIPGGCSFLTWAILEKDGVYIDCQKSSVNYWNLIPHPALVSPEEYYKVI